jgi:SAM-dependent methyltransferase
LASFVYIHYIKYKKKTGEAKMSEWYEEIFDIDYIQTYSEQHKRTSEDVDGMIELLSPTKEMKILDLCCGYGRHAIELARRGYKLIGYDLSSDLIEYARKKAVEENLKIDFIEGDVRDLDYVEKFDIVLNLFTSFGYFDDEENKEILNSIAKALVPGGRLLIQALSFSGAIRKANPENSASVFEGDNVTVITDNIWNIEKNILHAKRRLFFTDGKRREYSFDIRVYSLAEMLKMLKEVGLETVDYYSTLQGNAFNYQSMHYVIIAEKTP